MRKSRVLLFLLTGILALCGLSGCKEDNIPPVNYPVNDWPALKEANDYTCTDANLIWSDEFNGEALNGENWSYQTGIGSNGWGNQEKQYYREENARVNGGCLQIIARREDYINRKYTSARIRTAGKVTVSPGSRVEARMKLPVGQGFWPAFWMMPEDDVYGVWPHSGEIDIMEAKGSTPAQTSAAVHWGPSHTYSTGINPFADGGTIAEFHTYAVEWRSDRIEFFVDGNWFHSVSGFRWQIEGGSDGAPYDQDFYIILNLAVGGHFDGFLEPTDEMFAPAVMEVDYVRVYKLDSQEG